MRTVPIFPVDTACTRHSWSKLRSALAVAALRRCLRCVRSIIVEINNSIYHNLENTIHYVFCLHRG